MKHGPAIFSYWVVCYRKKNRNGHRGPSPAGTRTCPWAAAAARLPTGPEQ